MIDRYNHGTHIMHVTLWISNSCFCAAVNIDNLHICRYAPTVNSITLSSICFDECVTAQAMSFFFFFFWYSNFAASRSSTSKIRLAFCPILSSLLCWEWICTDDWVPNSSDVNAHHVVHSKYTNVKTWGILFNTERWCCINSNTVMLWNGVFQSWLVSIWNWKHALI